jgi:YD repeat-containing protein
MFSSSTATVRSFQSRTATSKYDPAGRLISKETTSSTGTTLPKVTYTYSTTTGLLTKETTGSGSSEQKITQEFNRVGALTSYTDAAGKTTTYEYEKEGDARLLKVTDEKSYRPFGYNETTGLLTSLKDSGGASFTATYDAEGDLASETTLPADITAIVTRNLVGEPIALKYVKEDHCTEKCEWYFDEMTLSIDGQWMNQKSTFGEDHYFYSAQGSLREAQEIPAGAENCIARVYGYDPDGNRTSITTRPPHGEGECATEGGETQEHQYDTADRLTDSSTIYNAFGDVTALPAHDAGGSELKSSFYTDGQLASQEQSGQTIGYDLDPARRTGETIETGHTTATVTAQYDGPQSTPSWFSYPSGEWTRNIFGIGGALTVTQKETEEPVIEIASLDGDIIATVPDSETATKLKTGAEATEWGVPTVTEPEKYSWLGAAGQ